MSYYSGPVREHFLRPRNVGEVEHVAARGEAGSLVCGAVVRISLRVDEATRQIADAKFKAAGCVYLIAAASLLTEAVKGLTIHEAVEMGESVAVPNALTEQLCDVPEEKAHCPALCLEALGAALDHYHEATRVEWNGEEALICTCFGVAEKSIEQAIRTRNLRTIEEVTRACNAGGGCHSCHPLIADILDDYWRTADVEM